MKIFHLSRLTGACLREVRVFGDSEMSGLNGILLTFDSATISVLVDCNDDTIKCTEGNAFPEYPGQIEKLANSWNIYLGEVVGFTWAMKNQADSVDAIQIMFTSSSTGYKIVQLMGIASEIVVFGLSNFAN